MGLEQFAVGFFITLGIAFCGLLFGFIVSFINDDGRDFTFFCAWFVSTIGFGICLTYILYVNGII